MKINRLLRSFFMVFVVCLIFNFFPMDNVWGQENIVRSSKNDFDTEILGIEWIKVPAGSFKMGSDKKFEEKPIHEVYVDEYFISKFEITHRQFIIFLNSIEVNSKGEYKGKVLINIRDKGCAVRHRREFFFKGNKFARTPDTPVINITWSGASEFCRWLSEKTGKLIHLPTEAQWEHAARGGNLTKNYEYSGENNFSLVGWCVLNSKMQVHPVGKKQANELGIFDMSGNVAEWCSDYFKAYYDFEWLKENPTGPSNGDKQVVKGGGWNNGIFTLRCASRIGYSPSYSGVSIGFRIARGDLKNPLKKVI